MFRIAPTALEVSLVCGILVRRALNVSGFPLTRWLAPTDIQVWMGFCCHHRLDDGRVFVVYSSYNLKEVNAPLASASVHLITLDPNIRIQYRRAVNQADNKAATVSIDSLINYEAVKVFRSPPSIRRSRLYCENPLSTSIMKSTRSHSMISIWPHTRNLRSRSLLRSPT